MLEIFVLLALIRKTIVITCLLITGAQCSLGQNLKHFADSIRRVYKIPELGYAVVSADHVYELEVLGYKKIGSKLQAERSDLFRIGSNTKAITGFIAATLVKQGRIKWDTRFFDLFPEMKAKSRPAYYDLTLLDLLSMRTKLFPYTYTYAEPVKGRFKGNDSAQRYEFAKWFFRHTPVASREAINFSNLGYIAAGLMLEKVSGKSYKTLVADLGIRLNVDFKCGQPNKIDARQPWGHDAHLVPEPPMDNYKLNWLLPAGNITLSLPDYVKFIQLQLRGLAGRSDMLTAEEFNFLFFGRTRFAVGWFSDTDDHKRVFSYNIGNPGTFLSYVYIYKGSDRAFIVFSNAQTDAAEQGIEVLIEEMKRRYL
jgi:CubicO group peptidase (beta-lactamase class C family)